MVRTYFRDMVQLMDIWMEVSWIVQTGIRLKT